MLRQSKALIPPIYKYRLKVKAMVKGVKRLANDRWMLKQPVLNLLVLPLVVSQDRPGNRA